MVKVISSWISLEKQYAGSKNAAKKTNGDDDQTRRLRSDDDDDNRRRKHKAPVIHQAMPNYNELLKMLKGLRKRMTWLKLPKPSKADNKAQEAVVQAHQQLLSEAYHANVDQFTK